MAEEMNHDEAAEMKLCELLADRPHAVGELAVCVRREVSGLAEGASEMLYKTYAVSNVFTFTHRLKEAFIHIATYPKHVNLGFNYGSKLDDTQGMLAGSGKLIRHIRIDTLDDLQQPAVRDLVQSAIEMGKEMAEDAEGIQAQRLIDKTT